MKKRVIISCISGGCVLLFFGLYYYIMLPVINIKSASFYFPLMLVVGSLVGLIFAVIRPKWLDNILVKMKQANKKKYPKAKSYTDDVPRTDVFFGGFTAAFAILIVVGIIIGISGSRLFRSKSYYKQLTIEEGTTEEFHQNFDFMDGHVKLPVIDKDLSFKLAQAKLSNYGAQYSIDSEHFTILSVNNELYRVTPLEYSGFFVSLSKMSEGSSGYIRVNVVTMESELILVPGGLKYLPSAKLKYDLKRHVQMSYPATMFSEYYFEIDDAGKPYWVFPTYDNEISLFSGANSSGVILCDPVSGETKKYNIGEEPTWVDRVVSDKLAETQATNALKYKNGFFNAHMGQKKEVFQASDGYNYFIKDNHTYYVSCMTSPNEADQTSIGFVAVDLKTRAAKKYYIDGITEMRCRSIAMLDESVKAQELEATWPILISYNKIPTYFVVLKNEVQYQKLCLINVSDGSSVAMENTMAGAINKYQSILANKNQGTEEALEITGEVTAVRDLGTTKEFMLSTLETGYFSVNIDLSLVARFLSVGDTVKIKYNRYNSYNHVISITKINN